MKNKTIDLNQYTTIEAPTESDCLTLILQTPASGEPVEPMHFIKKNRKSLVKSPDAQPWHKDIKIDLYCDQAEYNALVEWWFTELIDNGIELKAELNKIALPAIELSFPLPKEVVRAKNWLKTATKSERKSHIKRYLIDRITRNTKWWLGYSPQKRQYELNNKYKEA
jgi:hypothetical protein